MAKTSKDISGTLAATPVSSAAISGPRAIRYHAIDDRELESFMKFDRPFAVAFAAVFIGLALGTTFQAYGAFMIVQAGGAPPTTLEFAFLIGSPMSLSIGVTLAIVAARGRSEIAKALKSVRGRSQVSLPLGHPSAPHPQS